MSVLGKNTTTFCGTRTTVLLSSIHPPVILHCAGNGGLAGVGAGLSSLLHSPGDASREAYWMNPVISKPVGSLLALTGTMAGGGGTAAGVGHGIGLRLWADASVPSPMISSSSTTPATLKPFVSCSNPHILKLLPSYCFSYCSALLMISLVSRHATCLSGRLLVTNLAGPDISAPPAGFRGKWEAACRLARLPPEFPCTDLLPAPDALGR